MSLSPLRTSKGAHSGLAFRKQLSEGRSIGNPALLTIAVLLLPRNQAMRKKLILYFKRRNHARKQWVSHPWNLPGRSPGPGFLESLGHFRPCPPGPPGLQLSHRCVSGPWTEARDSGDTGKGSSCFGDAGAPGLSCPRRPGAGNSAAPFPAWKGRRQHVGPEERFLVRGPSFPGRKREACWGWWGGGGDGVGCVLAGSGCIRTDGGATPASRHALASPLGSRPKAGRVCVRTHAVVVWVPVYITDARRGRGGQ